MSKYITSLVYPSGSSISSGTTSQMDINIGTALWFAARGKGCLISLAEAQEMAVQFRPKVAQATKSMNATKTKSVDRSKNKKKKQKQKQNSTEAKSNTCNDGAGTGEAKTNIASSSENASSSCTVLSKFSQVSYQSPCRVLLSGLGADEYLAGYGRHRTAYRRGGAQELRRELILDAERLPERNHGRDDRCISDHAKEVRYPFLDEEVIRTVGTMSVETIAHMSLPAGRAKRDFFVKSPKIFLICGSVQVYPSERSSLVLAWCSQLRKRTRDGKNWLMLREMRDHSFKTESGRRYGGCRPLDISFFQLFLRLYFMLYLA